MGTEPCIVEVEFFEREAGPLRQTGAEIFSRLMMPPEPLARVRFFAIDILAKRIEECAEAERKRSKVWTALQKEESGVAASLKTRASVKLLARRLAELGVEARIARERAENVVGHTLLFAAIEHQEIAMQYRGGFFPLDSQGVLFLMREVEGRRPTTMTLYRGGTIAEPKREGMLMLA